MEYDYLVPRITLFIVVLSIGIWYVKINVPRESKKWIALKLIIAWLIFRAGEGWIPATFSLATVGTFLFLIAIYIKDNWLKKPKTIS